MQSFDCTSSRKFADVNSTGLQRKTVERKKKEPGQVSLFRINFTRILTFYCYKPSEQIDTALRTVKKLISCRILIRNPDFNSISSLTTTSSSSTLRTIKKFSNRILIQAPSYSIFEACDSLQDYSEESKAGRHCNSGELQKDRKGFCAKF